MRGWSLAVKGPDSSHRFASGNHNGALLSRLTTEASLARSPYHIARHEHLGDFLDLVQEQGLIAWQWGYHDSRAEFWIAEGTSGLKNCDTAAAEKVALRLARETGLVWFPVPHPGGERQREETVRRMRRTERTEG